MIKRIKYIFGFIIIKKLKKDFTNLLVYYIIAKVKTLGCSQVVRHETLTLACVGPNPATPARKNKSKLFGSDLFYL